MKAPNPIRVAIACVILAMSACAPVVTHGPRVKPGIDVDVAAGWRVGVCDSGCTAGLVPPIGATVAWGFLPRGADGPAFSVGAMIPGVIAIPLSTLDLYAQAPARAGAPVFGGGVLVSVQDVMPYLQLGRNDDGLGWYTTQGFVLGGVHPEPDVYLNGGSSVFDRVSTRYWSPTVAYAAEGVTFYASGALGSSHPLDAPRRPVRSILFGIILDEPRGTPFGRFPF